jgi:uncharacterized membrane protein
MVVQRPKIKIKLTRLDIYLEIMSAVFLIVYFLILCLSWTKLPDIIPTHFDFAGKINGYGSKGTLFILMPVVVGLYILFTILVKFPHIYNYAVDITEENAERQYRLAVRLMRVMKMVIIAVFTYIQYAIVSSAAANKPKLGGWFLPVVLIAVFLPLICYLFKSMKRERTK